MTGERVIFSIGDKVRYVGKFTGKIISETDVKLSDGTIVKSLKTQTHKFKLIKIEPFCCDTFNEFWSKASIDSQEEDFDKAYHEHTMNDYS